MNSEAWAPLGILLAILVASAFILKRALPGMRSQFKEDNRNMRQAARQTKRDIADMRALYRRARAGGLTRNDALRAAGKQFERGERDLTKLPPPAVPRRFALPKPQSPADMIGAVQTLLVNGVTAVGVFRLQWPVGTGLALYWVENVFTGIVVIAILALWRIGHADDPGQPIASTGEVVTIATVFNIGHLIFLAVCVFLVLPTVAASERFDRHTFLQGAAVIGGLMLFDFVAAVFRVRDFDGTQMQRWVSVFLQRVAVLHLAILFGMFAVLIFGRVRALFAVFTGLKVLADIFRKLE